MTGLLINSNVFTGDSSGVAIYRVVAAGDSNVSVGDMTGLQISSNVFIVSIAVNKNDGRKGF